MKVTLIQHAVGQGGLMSGLIEIQNNTFHWVYDCGSNQSVPLGREINSVVNRAIDVLFISHLDSDHINGIEKLLSSTNVKEVVLPYLNKTDVLIAAAHADATAHLTGSYAIFLSDISGWFNERGVENVTFIKPVDDDDDDDDDEVPPELPTDVFREGEGPLVPKWVGEQDKTDGLSNKKGVKLFESSAALSFSQSTGQLNWTLCPFAQRPSDKKLGSFYNNVKPLSNSGESMPDFFKRLLRDRELRKKLRKAYDVIWKDHNLVTMALYSGPLRPNKWKRKAPRYYRGKLYGKNSNTVGWLSTGDMHLNINYRRKSLIKHYGRSNLLDLVDVFLLPHHGSARNFDSSILEEMKNLGLCVAAASTTNSFGHPGTSVINSVNAKGLAFRQVSEKGHTTVRHIIEK